LCNSEIRREEVVEALLGMKGGKSAGIDNNITFDMLKCGGEYIVDWML